jgi:heptosyltransferase I
MSEAIVIAPPPQRILIIKPSSLGDVTHALPVFFALRKTFPQARISWLVAPYCAGLIQGLDGLDEVILFDRRKLGKAWYKPAALLDLFSLDRELRQRRFDLVVDLQGLFRSGWLSWRTGAKVRVGFANARELAWAFYTHRVPVETIEQHAVERYMKLAAALGCATKPVEFRFPVTEFDRGYARQLAGEQHYAVLMPGANWLTKRWPAERFASMVEPLKQRFGLACVIAGGADAAELAVKIPGALNLAGKTNLPQLVALLEGADLVIANDSGPMHIAAALNRPLVAIFGPTNPVRTGPFGRMDCVVRANVNCSPCYRRKCGHVRCLEELGIEAVLATAERQLIKA